MYCLRQLDRLVVVALVLRGEGEPVQREHPQGEVVVVLAVAVRAGFVVLADAQAAGERVGVAGVGEARRAAARAAEGRVHGADEGLRVGEVVRGGGGAVEG